MLRALLAKDLRRAWRNPIPWLINLALPLCMVGLIGLIFGNPTEAGLGRIRFAVVDEDRSVLTGMLRGAMNQGQGGQHLEPVFLERAEALRQLQKNALSAALVIPTNFTRDYLTGRAGVQLELIKNPAESIHPTVLEELAGVVVTALNALARNFQSEFPAWRSVFEGSFDFHKVSGLVEATGHKFEAARQYLNPPLVSYENGSGDAPTAAGTVAPGKANGVASAADTNLATAAVAGSTNAATAARNSPSSRAKPSPTAGIFAYLLIGLSAMFLLFIAGTAMNDLLRELRFRTFERYQTLRQSLVPFLLGKLLFGMVVVLLGSAALLGGGGLIFRIQWQQPCALAVLAAAYAAFATALMALFVVLTPDERRAGAWSNMSGMLLGIGGGCMFPRHQLPHFLGQHITPLLPSAWFAEAARSLQFGEEVSWSLAVLKLGGVSVVLVAAAVMLSGRRFRRGVRA